MKQPCCWTTRSKPTEAGQRSATRNVAESARPIKTRSLRHGPPFPAHKTSMLRGTSGPFRCVAGRACYPARRNLGDLSARPPMDPIETRAAAVDWNTKDANLDNFRSLVLFSCSCRPLQVHDAVSCFFLLRVRPLRTGRTPALPGGGSLTQRQRARRATFFSLRKSMRVLSCWISQDTTHQMSTNFFLWDAANPQSSARSPPRWGEIEDDGSVWTMRDSCRRSTYEM